MKPYEEIDKAIEIIATATDKWDLDEKQGPLWRVANRYPTEMVECFYRYPDHQHSIAWCLANQKNSIVKSFFLTEAGNKDQYIRWYSMINLRKYHSKDLINVFVQGLKDRSSLVKSESLIAVKSIKDDRIGKALTHLVGLKSFKQHSPGSYKQAVKLLRAYE